MTTLFAETYADSRDAFRAAARGVGATVTALPVPSATDADLTIDAAHLPATERPRALVVLTSGIHGPEGQAGGAVQRLVLEELLPAGVLDRRDTGVLLLHALNPYGFKHGRRVTEANVDLNRNFAIDPATFATKRTAYEALSPLLNPTRPARLGPFAEAAFLARAGRLLARHSMAALRQAIAEGQYQEPRGIFFGGERHEPHVALVERAITRAAEPYEAVLALDLHTGFGERGRLHLLDLTSRDPACQAFARHVYGDLAVERIGGDAAFYTADGDLATFVGAKLAARGKRALSGVAELGTVDSQTLAGSVRTIRRVILENQAHWHGAVDEATRARIRAAFRELFFPSAPEWREAAILGARTTLTALFGRLEGA